MRETDLVILQDTREQKGYYFEGYQNNCETRRYFLQEGDYTIESYPDQVAIERKELGDLIQCCKGAPRERFKRELRRLAPYTVKAVVVEATMEDVARAEYRSRIAPQAVLGSVFSWQVAYGVPVVWGGDRAGSEWATFNILRHAQRHLDAVNYATGGELNPQRFEEFSEFIDPETIEKLRFAHERGELLHACAFKARKG